MSTKNVTTSTGFLDILFITLDAIVDRLDRITSELSEINSKMKNEKNEKVELWKKTIT